MNLIKVKNCVIDFDKVIFFKSGLCNGSVDIYLNDTVTQFCLDIRLSDFCDLLKFYNIEIKELK